MKLAIADPPYFGRADRWYGDGVGTGRGEGKPDYHPEAAEWDTEQRHRQLVAQLFAEYDGWALAGNVDSLPIYLDAAGDRFGQRGDIHVGIWHRPGAVPSGARVMQLWEPVVFCIPEGRKGHSSGLAVSDVLTAAPARASFIGSKPAVWTRWTLAVMGYDPLEDTVDDLFAGSGAVAAAADGMLA